MGGSGNDTYVVTSKGGKMEIIEMAGNGADKLVFKDLNRSDIEASRDSDNNMVLSWDSSPGEITINDAGADLEQFVFADGTVLQPDDFAIV
ncbi:calcium-binding protein [uncultured Roseibium sp.]|uniref:calcium-binding protein n=1 Tax=uncultured Roseibium sp. TaxID=1936171 RepID=UPI002618A7AE|nr:calcium-binding protein [uncultured Roseibium sp.]